MILALKFLQKVVKFKTDIRANIKLMSDIQKVALACQGQVSAWQSATLLLL